MVVVLDSVWVDEMGMVSCDLSRSWDMRSYLVLAVTIRQVIAMDGGEGN